MPMVYLSPSASNAPTHRIHVCPGADKETIGSGTPPSDWIYDDGVNPPVNSSFVVEFHYGVAEVPAHLYKYLIKSGIARATRLLIPEDAGFMVPCAPVGR